MGLLCLPPKVWYNKVMETISGGPSEQFIPDTILQAAKLNKALENWVVTEVPGEDEGEIGDVVFVTGPGDGGSSPVGGGKVLQVVRETDSSLRTTNSTSFVDVAGMSVTITPQKSDSAILVVASMKRSNTLADDSRGITAITDNNDNVLSGAELATTGAKGSLETSDAITIIGYSTPATMSAVTYKLMFRSTNAASASFVENDGNTGQIYAIEVSA